MTNTTSERRPQQEGAFQEEAETRRRSRSFSNPWLILAGYGGMLVERTFRDKEKRIGNILSPKLWFCHGSLSSKCSQKDAMQRMLMKTMHNRLEIEIKP